MSAYCPLYKDKCPEDEEKCTFWIKKEIISRCKVDGCVGYGFDCDWCPSWEDRIIGGKCGLKTEIKKSIYRGFKNA